MYIPYQYLQQEYNNSCDIINWGNEPNFMGGFIDTQSHTYEYDPFQYITPTYVHMRQYNNDLYELKTLICLTYITSICFFFFYFVNLCEIVRQHSLDILQLTGQINDFPKEDYDKHFREMKRRKKEINKLNRKVNKNHKKVMTSQTAIQETYSGIKEDVNGVKHEIYSLFHRIATLEINSANITTNTKRNHKRD